MPQQWRSPFCCFAIPARSPSCRFLRPQCAVRSDSKILATASADSSVRLWDVTGGQELFKFQFHAPCRSVSYSFGEELLVTTQDQFMSHKPHISILRVPRDIEEQEEYAEPLRRIELQMPGRVTRAAFSPVNDTIITTHEDGHIRRWDTETGKLVADKHVHEKNINDMRFSPDYTHFITASTDRFAKLIDTETFEVLKVYNAERPCNSADISPVMDHVVIGGGQDAASVTTTSSKAGKFEAAFFHKIYEEEFGQVRGHFGPINSICFSPDGRKVSLVLFFFV